MVRRMAPIADLSWSVRRPARKRSLKAVSQGPPPAIIGPLVEIAVHDVDRKACVKLVVVQQRRHDRVVQVGDRAFENRLGLGAGAADLLQQNLRKRRVPPSDELP